MGNSLQTYVLLGSNVLRVKNPENMHWQKVIKDTIICRLSSQCKEDNLLMRNAVCVPKKQFKGNNLFQPTDSVVHVS